MGRELRRVPLDFNFPIDKTWTGFLNPYPGPPTCPECDGHGVNAATREIDELFYDHDGFGVRWHYEYNTAPDGTPATRPPWKIIGDCRRWGSDITQDEVEALVKAHRLYDFTHTWTREHGWQPKTPPVMPTAAEVNHWNDHGFMGHDCLNRGILVEQRARRLGVYGKCQRCRGKGSLRLPRKMKKRYTHWKEVEPPTGPGYQVWQTVSEGGPCSPVFASPDDLALWLVEHEGYDPGAATAFVSPGGGWAPSMIAANGKVYRDIDALSLEVTE